MLARPELFRLLGDAHPGDVLLVEQVDRLSRLTAADWERLKADLTAGDEFTMRMFEAINGMLLDMLAAVVRKDYVDRRRRQAQGQAKARRPKVATRGARRIRSAMTGSPACSPRVSLGDQSRAPPAAAALRSPRLPSASSRPPNARDAQRRGDKRSRLRNDSPRRRSLRGFYPSS
jgi:hypothetical protein